MHDFIVIGAGIIGLATAYQIQLRYPTARILLIDKEPGPAQHQSGRNSGVIHAGVYYPADSLKARFCRQGSRQIYAFCSENALPCRQPGKLVVASNQQELRRLGSLQRQCQENGLKPEWLESSAIRDLEPGIEGEAAIRISESGITSYPLVCRKLLDIYRNRGGEVALEQAVTDLRESDRYVTVQPTRQTFSAGQLIVCGGLMADRLARMQDLDIDFQIIPFRGEYFRLKNQCAVRPKHLIYPVPDPALPFLGIHLTPTIDGSILLGPNAVLGWKREGYGRLNFNVSDSLDLMKYPGFWRLGAKYWRAGLTEYAHSISRRSYLNAARRYAPTLKTDDLKRARTGVRAQAVTADGELMHDFVIKRTPRSLHVCNAPSPAATSAFPIAEHICSHFN